MMLSCTKSIFVIAVAINVNQLKLVSRRMFLKLLVTVLELCKDLRKATRATHSAPFGDIPNS